MRSSTRGATSPIGLDYKLPQVTATLFVAQHHRDAAHHLTLYHQGGVFYAFDQASGYRVYEEATLRAQLFAFLSHAVIQGTSQPFGITNARMNDVLNIVRAICHLPTARAAPCWLDASITTNPYDELPCGNGLLHLPTRTLAPATPLFFSTAGVTLPYLAHPHAPDRWLLFLHELWPGDIESQDALQEWMGYLLTAHTYFQKILLLVGPARSGKGTIGRVIERLLGDDRVCAPTLASLAMPFGIAALIDKSAALIADARLTGRADNAMLTERLLSISGQDRQTIPRKYLPDWNGPLPVRFTIMTNELPKIEDSSGALASRFLLLLLRESFLGREDHLLFEKFMPELPAILVWALDGWDRVRARGRFQMPDTSVTVMQEFQDLGSPIRAFLRDECTVQTGLRVQKDTLYTSWKTWCAANGRDHPGTSQLFSRNIRAALPYVLDTRTRTNGTRFEHWEGLGLGTTQTAIY